MQSDPKLLLVLCLVITGVSYVLAQDEADDDSSDDGLDQDALTVEQMRAMHSKLDGDGDGRASMAEVLDYAHKMRVMIAKKDIHTILNEMDTDRDGKLNLEELLKDMDMQSEGSDEDAKEIMEKKETESQKFNLADNNGDGKLDVDELPSLFYPETHQGVLELTAKVTLTQKDMNKDGQLTAKEFWEGDSLDGEETAISEEETADFEKLDTDRNGKLDLNELTAWESGRFHTEEALKKLFELADKDSDMHVTADELANSREQIAGSDAQYHLMEWAEHHEL